MAARYVIATSDYILNADLAFGYKERVYFTCDQGVIMAKIADSEAGDRLFLYSGVEVTEERDGEGADADVTVTTKQLRPEVIIAALLYKRGNALKVFDPEGLIGQRFDLSEIKNAFRPIDLGTLRYCVDAGHATSMTSRITTLNKI